MPDDIYPPVGADPCNAYHEAFWNFAYRLNSLHRYWLNTGRHIQSYLTDLKKLRTGYGCEEAELFCEGDEEYFLEFLRGSILSHSLTLLEVLLSDVAKDVTAVIATPTEVEGRSDEKRLPYINRYLLFLTRTCGFQIDIPTGLWSELDAIRELRNRYIHKLDRDLPTQIQNTLARMATEVRTAEKPVDDSFVHSSMTVVADIGQTLEYAYWEWRAKTAAG